MSIAAPHHDAGTDAVSETNEVTPKVASQEILHHEIVEGKDALERPPGRLFFSGLSAGLEIGFSLFLMGVMRTVTRGHLDNAVVELLSANMYSFGFVLVILGRSEFFTEQTSLAVLPVLNRESSVAALLRLWLIVFISNVIGAVTRRRPDRDHWPAAGSHLAGVAWRNREGSGRSSRPDNSPERHTGRLVDGLAVVGRGGRSGHDQSDRDRVDGDGGHRLGASAPCHFGKRGSLAGVFASRGATFGDYGHFLLWTTLGNIIGGSFFVALLKYAQARPVEAA